MVGVTYPALLVEPNALPPEYESDSECAGEEHKAREDTPAKPSFCTLPMFHPPAAGATRGVGYVSTDGHQFDCRNPAVMKAAFHV
jgi:hypothetical protein